MIVEFMSEKLPLQAGAKQQRWDNFFFSKLSNMSKIYINTQKGVNPIETSGLKVVNCDTTFFFLFLLKS